MGSTPPSPPDLDRIEKGVKTITGLPAVLSAFVRDVATGCDDDSGCSLGGAEKWITPKDKRQFLRHLNILLSYRLFGNVHFFRVRSDDRIPISETDWLKVVLQLEALRWF
jgi:hypothetical protein